MSLKLSLSFFVASVFAALIVSNLAPNSCSAENYGLPLIPVASPTPVSSPVPIPSTIGLPKAYIAVTDYSLSREINGTYNESPAVLTYSRHIDYVLDSPSSTANDRSRRGDTINFMQSYGTLDLVTGDKTIDADSGYCSGHSTTNSNTASQVAALCKIIRVHDDFIGSESSGTSSSTEPWPSTLIFSRPYQCVVNKHRRSSGELLTYEENYSEKSRLNIFVDAPIDHYYKVRVSLDVMGIKPLAASVFPENTNSSISSDILLSESSSTYLSPQNIQIPSMTAVPGTTGVWEGVIRGSTFNQLKIAASYGATLKDSKSKVIGSSNCIRYNVKAVWVAEEIEN